MAIKFIMPGSTTLKNIGTMYWRNETQASRIGCVIRVNASGTPMDLYRLKYNVLANVANCSLIMNEDFLFGKTATGYITPNTGYSLPDSLAILDNQATIDYNSEDGTFTLSNPKVGATSITVIGNHQLIAPTISLSGDILSIVDNDGDATQFEIYVDGVLKTTIDKQS